MVAGRRRRAPAHATGVAGSARGSPCCIALLVLTRVVPQGANLMLRSLCTSARMRARRERDFWIGRPGVFRSGSLGIQGFRLLSGFQGAVYILSTCVIMGCFALRDVSKFRAGVFREGSVGMVFVRPGAVSRLALII